MLLSIPEFVILLLGFFSIATLYSSVGFGGGSSYLAFLTLFFVSFFTIRSVALVCNLIVVTGSTYHYWKNGHLTIKKFLPFIITSIPFAFIGARFRLSEQLFFIVLSIALIISALVLIYQTTKLKKSEEVSVHYPLYLNYVLGAAIGFLSGLVGIGGGIFLAPILHDMKWDKSIKIAALASFFILINSISGIAGLVSKGVFEFPWMESLGLVVAVFIGGQIGIRLSLSKFTSKSIKIVTAILVLVVGIRVLLINGLQVWG